MKTAPILASAAVLLLALTACSPSPTSPPILSSPTSGTSVPVPTPTPASVVAECPATRFDVTLTYELVIDISGGVTIEAESNLPNGAEIKAGLFVLDGYYGQDEGVLERGKITFGPFSDKGTPLHGDYELTITLSTAGNQPDAVQACIGDAGENMTGPLVSAHKITGDKLASVGALVSFG